MLSRFRACEPSHAKPFGGTNEHRMSAHIYILGRAVGCRARVLRWTGVLFGFVRLLGQ